MNIDCKEQYRRLFPDPETKAKAFDQIAEQYYFSNFGSMSKSDIDLMMFSIYLERLLDTDEEKPSAYSDYTLSKYLAVTQSRISAMKVRKQLKYPRDGFDWKKAYQRCAGNVNYEGGKIKVHLSDRNVFLEIKNAIEEAGGYVELTLTSNLLQVDPEYYVDLMMKIRGEEDRKAFLAELRKDLKERGQDAEELEKKTLPELFRECGVEFVSETVNNLVAIPFLSEPVRELSGRLTDYLVSKGKKLIRKRHD